MTILKRFRLTETASIQLRMELLNVLNHHYFGGVDLDMNSASFGNIRTASGARTGQLGARIEW